MIAVRLFSAKIALAVLVVFSYAMHASAQTLLRIPDFTVEQVQAAADEGDAEALYILASVYFKGVRTPRDYRKAVDLFTRAGELGLALAQLHLGEMYYDGTKIPQNDAEALRWYQAAALQGLTEAQYGLAKIYADGMGVAKDFQAAASWYMQAAVQGHENAQLELGLLYAAGAGVDLNLTESYKWLVLSSSQGLADAVTARDEIRGRLTADQVATAQREAGRFRPTPHYNSTNLDGQVSNIVERVKALAAAIKQ